MLNTDFLNPFKNDERYHNCYLEERDINDILIGVNVKKMFKIIISGYTTKTPIPKLLGTLYIFNDNSLAFQVGSFCVSVGLRQLAQALSENDIEIIKKHIS